MAMAFCEGYHFAGVVVLVAFPMSRRTPRAPYVESMSKAEDSAPVDLASGRRNQPSSEGKSHER